MPGKYARPQNGMPAKYGRPQNKEDAMKEFLKLCLAAVWVMLTGCGLMRPASVNAGYYIENKPDSKTTIMLGTNNSQANAIHAAIGDAGTADGEKAEAVKEDEGKAGQTAKSSGLFVNNNVGDRSAEVDATAALEMLKDVQGTSAGQAQTTSKGNESPSTGTQSQTPSNTQTDTTTLALPVAVGQSAPTATADQSKPAEAAEAAK